MRRTLTTAIIVAMIAMIFVISVQAQEQKMDEGSNFPAGFATPAQVQAGLNAGVAISPAALAQAAAIKKLVFGDTTTWNFGTGWNASLTLTGNTTLAVINPIQGMVYALLVTQDAVGSRTITWPASFNWGVAGAPSLTTTPNLSDVIIAWCIDAVAPQFLVFSRPGF